ncbi:MAG: UvrD-helicase domain-containing protein [Actinomycetota bacterium]|nr:UvrD-helicase domain-containing protein [Actinomycetota bacterium]
MNAPPFDVAGPVPHGVTVLEASAGTGKTYAIAALAARYVAEGIPLERILLVTFTRMATGELRERVRDRLGSVEQGLARAHSGFAVTDDRVVELLATGPPEVVKQRRARLTRALADFDAATIATIHGFCQEVIGGLGIAADLAPSASLAEDVSDLVSEVVDDLYVRRFHREAAPPLRRAEALEIARFAVEHPRAAIVPASGAVPEMRQRLAIRARTELEERKRRAGVVTYDDLLAILDDALRGPDGDAIAATLREAYEVVLVDEFQDTDPVQWSIMRRAFGGPGRTLVLIADPKQAIYAFRGADVHAYLEAAQDAVAQATLTTNWRSDQGLIDAYDALFGNAKLGEEGIVYRRVHAAPANRRPRLRGAPHEAPLRIRVVAREALELTNYGYARKESAREHIARDLSSDLVELLSSGAELETRGEDATTLGYERVCPGHVAVLVRTNQGAALVRSALEAAGVPAVINGAGSVFATDTAREWLRLLEAIERPASISRAHSAALTDFIGWRPERMASADEATWGEVHRRLHEWARVLRTGGVASLVQRIALMEGLTERMLVQVDGERRLTDLRHVGQLLHSARLAEGLGTTALTAWLRRRILEAGADTSDEERSRRLESDSEAVQVLTIHRSKGLEFPIVYVPFLWEATSARDRQPVSFHDPAAGYERVLDVALEGAEFQHHRQQAMAEERGEDLRIAYVALTRARHQAVIWWAGSWDSRDSPLGRLLFFRDADGNVAPAGRFTPDDETARRRFQSLAEQAPGRIGVERSALVLPATWRPGLPTQAELSAAAFHRTLDRRWRRTSYSDITAGSHGPLVASEPEDPVITDEPAAVEPPVGGVPATDPASAIASPLATMPVGLEVGTFVHRMLELTEFDAGDIDAELAARCAALALGRSVEIGDPAALCDGIRAAIETPLGPVLGGASLREFSRADRLDELVFELPIAGGEHPDGWLSLRTVAEVLREWVGPADPLAGYADRLAEPALRQSFRGYLTGTLDLVVRIAGADGSRFVILDYKTNWLAGPDEPLTTWHYRPEALRVEMYRRHYALQALLYTVALHRYLRWRVPDYSCDRQLAGFAYLFLRGMTGPATPVLDGTPCGVFGWRPAPGLIEALSDALDRGAPA